MFLSEVVPWVGVVVGITLFVVTAFNVAAGIREQDRAVHSTVRKVRDAQRIAEQHGLIVKSGYRQPVLKNQPVRASYHWGTPDPDSLQAHRDRWEAEQLRKTEFARGNDAAF